MTNRTTFGTRIKILRTKLCISQRELADLMGVTPQAACKWENDFSCPDIMTLPRLALILNVSLDDLFAEEFKFEIENMTRNKEFLYEEKINRFIS